MGDRWVVGFRDTKDSPILYLYAHSGGEYQVQAIGKALAKVIDEGRVTDPAYATRIATSSIIGEAWDRGTGYGLSINEYVEPDYPYVNVVTWDSAEITLRDSLGVKGEPMPLATFVEFAKMFADDLYLFETIQWNFSNMSDD